MSSTYMILVSGGDFCVEDKVIDVAGAVVIVVPVCVLFKQGKQATRIEEGSKPICRHLLTTLQHNKHAKVRFTHLVTYM